MLSPPHRSSLSLLFSLDQTHSDSSLFTVASSHQYPGCNPYCHCVKFPMLPLLPRLHHHPPSRYCRLCLCLKSSNFKILLPVYALNFGRLGLKKLDLRVGGLDSDPPIPIQIFRLVESDIDCVATTQIGLDLHLMDPRLIPTISTPRYIQQKDLWSKIDFFLNVKKSNIYQMFQILPR